MVEIKYKKLIGTAALGLFVALVFLPGSSVLTAAHSNNNNNNNKVHANSNQHHDPNPNTIGKDHGGVAGTGTHGNGNHDCYARTSGLPEGCRNPQ
jgi:hypothetical protein